MFNPERRKLAKKYNKTIKKHNWYYRIYYILFWGVLICYQLELKLYKLISGYFKYREIIIIIYILTFYVLYKFIIWIFDYFLSYRLNREFKISRQTSLDWLTDKIKAIILNLILLLIAGRLIIFLYQISPEYWWIFFTLIGSAFIIIIQYLVPIVIIPLFFDLTPYPENNFKKKLQGLFKKAGLKIEDIYEIKLSLKTNTANAAVAGLGRSRRILLSDTLEDNYTEEEIEAIMAHEIGHTIHHDQFKSIIIQSLILLFTSYIISIVWPYFFIWRGHDVFNTIVFLPTLYFLYGILNYILLPPYLALRRKQEKEADKHSVKLIDRPENLISALVKLADNNLSTLKLTLYEKLFQSSHPGVMERIKTIRKYCK